MLILSAPLPHVSLNHNYTSINVFPTLKIRIIYTIIFPTTSYLLSSIRVSVSGAPPYAALASLL